MHNGGKKKISAFRLWSMDSDSTNLEKTKLDSRSNLDLDLDQNVHNLEVVEVEHIVEQSSK